MKVSVALFDADGVLTLPEEVFSIVYARSRGIDIKPLEDFFRNDWRAIVTGKKDLKESITENRGLWQWEGSVDELLAYWFKTEDVRNEKLVELIRVLRDQGIPCYLATDQDRYRGEYMKNVMFKDVFTGFFISAEMGVSKTDARFFENIIKELQNTYPELKPQDIIFFDDSQSKVNTACSLGINGQLYKNIEQVQSLAGDY